MPKISREDYDSLELKIQAEIKKVFSQFVEEQENKTPGPDETIALHEPGSQYKSIPTRMTPVPAAPKQRRGPKKSIRINKMLDSIAHAGAKDPGNILESDMNKIFRKKHRRGAD